MGTGVEERLGVPEALCRKDPVCVVEVFLSESFGVGSATWGGMESGWLVRSDGSSDSWHHRCLLEESRQTPEQV